MIWPVKTFRGKQAFDAEHKTLVVTHVSGADDTAYWKNLNWENAIATGMQTAGMPFSGKVEGIYIPGRDSIPLLDNGIKLLALLTLLAMIGHGVLRIFTSKKH